MARTFSSIGMLTAVVGICVSTFAHAQQDQNSPAFAVVSIKTNTSKDPRAYFRILPDGQLIVANMPVALMIRAAYDIPDFQLSGVPGWANTEHFDVAAKADGNPSRAEVVSMWKAMLKDRFKLGMHTETKDVSTMTLTVARPGKLGPRLNPAAECLPPQPGAVPSPTPNEPPRWGGRFDAGRIFLRGTTMQQFANLLGRSVFASTLLDKTDLTGKYDLDLDYAPDPAPPTPAAPDPAPADPNNPSIYTAIQEQLGLKLESIKAPGQVLVIDHIERPTAD